MSHHGSDEHAVCRGCGKVLRGEPFYKGGQAFLPIPGRSIRALTNFYGGFVCSRECDWRAALDLEQTMPGHGYTQRTPICYPPGYLDRKWSDHP